MKKKKSLLVLICFLIISFFLTLVPQKALAQSEEIDITAIFGIDGVYKYFSTLPMEIEMKNTLKEELNGELEILVQNKMGSNDSYTTKFRLGSEETKKIIVPINSVSEQGKVKVKALVNGNILGEKELIMSATAVYDSAVIGAFSDDMKPLEYLNNFNTKDSNQIKLQSSKVIELTNDILTSNYKNLQMIDIILINNYDSSKFTEEALKNLNLWIKNGGVLLIGGGTSTLNNMNKSFLNFPSFAVFSPLTGFISLLFGQLGVSNLMFGPFSATVLLTTMNNFSNMIYISMALQVVITVILVLLSSYFLNPLNKKKFKIRRSK